MFYFCVECSKVFIFLSRNVKPESRKNSWSKECCRFISNKWHWLYMQWCVRFWLHKPCISRKKAYVFSKLLYSKQMQSINMGLYLVKIPNCLHFTMSHWVLQLKSAVFCFWCGSQVLKKTRIRKGMNILVNECSWHIPLQTKCVINHIIHTLMHSSLHPILRLRSFFTK